MPINFYKIIAHYLESIFKPHAGGHGYDMALAFATGNCYIRASLPRACRILILLIDSSLGLKTLHCVILTSHEQTLFLLEGAIILVVALEQLKKNCYTLSKPLI